MKHPFAVGLALGAAAVLALEYAAIELFAWLQNEYQKDRP